MNTLIDTANLAADRWATWMIAASLEAAVLLALAGVLWFAIRKHASPQVGYLLFLLVPLKLLLPISVTAPAAIASWTPAALVSPWLAHVAESASRDVPQSLGAVEAPLPTPTSLAADSTVDTKAPRPSRMSAPVRSSPNPAAAARANTPVAPARRSPSAAAILMFAWLAVVITLALRFAWAQYRFRGLVRHLEPIDESRLCVNLQEMMKLAGVSRSVRVAVSDEIAAPAVWGLRRPTIILPRDLACSLAPAQLRWVLLHELAHVRRRDLAVVVAQRCAAMLHFFNPAVWVANRMVHRLREYACDDLAVSLSEGSVVEFGRAFVEVLRHANRERRIAGGALGVFGLDSKASCTLRVQRLLDCDRTIRVRPGPASLAALAILAALVLPHWRTAGVAAEPASAASNEKPPPETSPTPMSSAESGLAEVDKQFELRVLDAAGNPVPEATVELRTDPSPTGEQIAAGKFVKTSRYGALAATDAEGRLVLKLARTPKGLRVNITTSGYAPYWADWYSESHPQPIPARFTAVLDAGWSVGGVLVDEERRPVEGVEVHPSIQFKKRPGDLEELHIGTGIKTDAAGAWRFDSVPASQSEVSVEISHPSFMPIRRSLTRGQFGIAAGGAPTTKIELDRGLIVVGRVSDEEGKPIAGALLRANFMNSVRQTRTEADGTYRLIGCEPATAKIVVSAKGKATDMKEVKIDAEMQPVDFELQPGGHVRVRVLDQNDIPIPRARIFFQRWRGAMFSYFEFDHVNQYANKDGEWEWNEAPLDGFEADICGRGGAYMQLGRQFLAPRDEEYVFRLPPALVISGKVVDAETKQPVRSFLVVPGVRHNGTQMSWDRGGQFTAEDGKFEIRHHHDYFAHLVRIEAGGYRTAVSRDIKSNEGTVTIDFELHEAADVVATVLAPDGSPASGAQIALGIEGAQINVANGALGGGTYALQTETDAAGRFRLPAQTGDFQLVIVHPTGYAHVKATPDSMPARIDLEPWARVEGVFRVGKNPVAGATITIYTTKLNSYGAGVANIFTNHEATTGSDGHFVFERVVPGEARIGRNIFLTVSDGAREVTSSSRVAADFPPGETTHIDLGGTGRPVVGKLEPAERFKGGRVNWQLALIDVAGYFPAPPELDEIVPKAIAADAALKAAWLDTWKRSAAGQAWAVAKAAYDANQKVRDNSPRFTATVGRDGSFRIDDMPPGEYSLSVSFSRDPAGQLRDYRVSVSRVPEGAQPEVDLGVVALE